MVLTAALAVFVLAGLPMIGYAAAAAAWLAQRGIQVVAGRRATAEIVAATTLGRVWLMATVVLLTGLLAEREDGLAAAILVVVLFTVSFAAAGIAHLFEPEAKGAAQ
jgi:hypothetical protein